MYIGATALLALGWLLCPYIALAVSVSAGMVHFGLNDTKGRPGSLPFVDFITRGGLMSLAVKCQPDATAWIVRQLVPGSLDGPMHALMVLGSIHVVCLAISVTYHAMKCHKAHHLEMLVEQVVLTAVFAVLPPLLSFAIYINAVYTPRLLLRASHLSAVRDVLNQFWIKNRSTTGIVVMAAVLCATVFVRSSQQISLEGATYAADGGLCKAVLILLSVISTPHTMLMCFGEFKTEAPGAASLERSLV
jgi:Brp/Blh family beta-carotene 15,15'-monooxygenase